MISSTRDFSTDPVISETGFAAWTYYGTNDNSTGQSHIGLFVNGQQRDLTGDFATLLRGATKPFVHSNRVVFIANHNRYRDDDVTWVLREVPVRDEGDITEIPALYRAYEEGGEQRLEPVLGGLANTNDAVVPVVGVDTNAARRHPSGITEVWSWNIGDAEITRVTHDNRNDFAPTFWGDTIAWQKAKGWPFGWEIMALNDGSRMQLTTNYYYDMAPKVYGDQIVWYGWDGFDYEIYLADVKTGEIIQLTDNRYDDVAPEIWDGVVVWEGYPAVEADIFMWRNGEITKISSNIDDDLYPRIWGDKVVWQGFDGDDFEIYLYDITKGETIQLTGNRYDDTNPEIANNLVTWVGFEGNWDSEIFYLDVSNVTVGNINPVQLTNNEQDDRDVKTGGRRIIWVTDIDGKSAIMLAEPR